MTDKRESFTRNDILRALANYIDDPLKLGPAIEQVMRSPELIALEENTDGNEENFRKIEKPALNIARMPFKI